MKTESLAPPLCLLGDDPTSPFETIQINVGPTSDDPSGNNSLHQPQALARLSVEVCVGGGVDCCWEGRVGSRTGKKGWGGEMADNQERGQEGGENFKKPQQGQH